MIILIADDDRLIRFSLKSMLLDIVSSDTKIIEAKNGKEMVQLCTQNNPEIVFADISMPCLDGISAISECQKVSPNSQFVILTAYSDFNYAKKCISLKVSEYILKPIDCEQLKELMERLIKNISDTQETRNSKFQLNLINLFHLWDETGVKDNEQSIEKSNYYAFVFFIDCAIGSDIYAKNYRRLLVSLKSAGNEFLKNNTNYALLNSKEGFLRLIFKDSENNFCWILNQISKICKELSKDCLITSFYTQKQSLNSIYKICEQIERKQYLRYIYQPCKVHLYENKRIEKGIVNFSINIDKYLSAFQNMDEMHLHQTVKNIKSTSKSTSKLINLNCVSSYISVITKSEIQNKDLITFYKSLYNIRTIMYSQSNKNFIDKIENIKNYIQKNYMNDISINSIAEKFDLTPNYLSKTFHKKAGIKFIDYLTDVRVSNAKRILIQNYQASIKDVALMVGYYSPRYFANVFQKYTGTYPSEFRKIHHRSLPI